MTDRKFHIHDPKAGAAITVRVTPRAGRTAISGILEDGTVKIVWRLRQWMETPMKRW